MDATYELIAFVSSIAFVTFAELSLALCQLHLLHSVRCTYFALRELHYIYCVCLFKAYNSLCRLTVS